MPPEWWRDFFQGAAAEFWHACVPASMTEAEADFVARTFAPGARLLDVPCGAGRITCALARRGFHLTGVDLSVQFLTWARAAGQNLTVDWQQRDMRDLPWSGAFDGAFCLGNSFGYLGDDGDAAFLRALRKVLRAGAVLVLEAVTAEALFPVFQPRRWFAAGELLMLSEITYDAVAGEVRSDYTFVRGDGTRERCTAWQRVRTAREVIALLRAAGFDAVRVLGDADATPLDLRGGQGALFLAESA